MKTTYIKLSVAALTIMLLIFMIFLSLRPLQAQTTRPKILVLYFDEFSVKGYGSFVTAYGDVVTEYVPSASKKTLDYFKQFDLFVVYSDYDNTIDAGWGKYLDLASNILKLVEEGKSILGVYIYCGTGTCSPSPLDSFAKAWEHNFGSERTISLNITSSPITMGVRSLNYRGKYLIVLSGRYPTLLTPVGPGMPDPPVALAVYGQHGSGKYVALSGHLIYEVKGDIGVFLSNVLYWLTNREVPPLPSFVDLDRRVSELNTTIDSLYLRVQQLRSQLDQLSSQLASIPSQQSQLVDQVNQLTRSLNDLNTRLNQLSNELSQVKITLTSIQSKMQAQEPSQRQEANLAVPISIATLSIVLSITALIISIIKKK